MFAASIDLSSTSRALFSELAVFFGLYVQTTKRCLSRHGSMCARPDAAWYTNRNLESQ